MKFRSYDDAKKFLRPLKLKNYNEWVEYCKSGNKPEDIPENPWDVYEKEWYGSMTFLDAYSSPCVDKGYRTYGEAENFVRKLNLKNSREWREYCKSGNKPDAIPNLPEIIYEKEGWFGWDYWLGIGKPSYRSFKDARKFIRSVNLKNSEEWREYCKSGNKPSDIPSNPREIYKKIPSNMNDKRIPKY